MDCVQGRSTTRKKIYNYRVWLIGNKEADCISNCINALGKRKASIRKDVTYQTRTVLRCIMAWDAPLATWNGKNVVCIIAVYQE
jgi:hypothetical protein